jgi:hypothetical protein
MRGHATIERIHHGFTHVLERRAGVLERSDDGILRVNQLLEMRRDAVASGVDPTAELAEARAPGVAA